MSGADGRAQLLRGEGDDLLGAPVTVAPRLAREGRVLRHRLPAPRIEVRGVEEAELRPLDHRLGARAHELALLPRLRLHAERDQRREQFAGREIDALAHPVFSGRSGESAEARAHALLIVDHVAAARLAGVEIERVVLDDVDVVDPRGPHAEAAQIASVFVRHAIVVVVPVASEIRRPAERFARDPAAGQHAHALAPRGLGAEVGGRRGSGVRQQAVERLAQDRLFVTQPIFAPGIGRQHQLVGVHVEQRVGGTAQPAAHARRVATTSIDEMRPG